MNQEEVTNLVTSLRSGLEALERGDETVSLNTNNVRQLVDTLRESFSNQQIEEVIATANRGPEAFQQAYPFIAAELGEDLFDKFMEVFFGGIEFFNQALETSGHVIGEATSAHR